MAYISVEIGLDEVIEHLNGRELEELARSLIADGYGDTAPVEPEETHPNPSLNNPAYRLEVITWLRNNGYRVEGGGPL